MKRRAFQCLIMRSVKTWRRKNGILVMINLMYSISDNRIINWARGKGGKASSFWEFKKQKWYGKGIFRLELKVILIASDEPVQIMEADTQEMIDQVFLELFF